MVEGIQNHIGSFNWGYRSALSDKGVKYINGRASFLDPHTVKVCTCYIAIRYSIVKKNYYCPFPDQQSVSCNGG